MSDNDKVTNLDYLEELSLGEEEMMREMIELFLKQSPEYIGNMRELYEQEDWAALRSEAHKMKPTLNYMGIDSLKDTIQSIESNARYEDNLDNIPAMIDEVDEVCKKAYEELNDTLQELA